MTTIETTIQRKTTSLSIIASDTLSSDFSNIHQNTNGVFVNQTTSDISKWKTRKTFFSATFVHIGICLTISDSQPCSISLNYPDFYFLFVP